LSLNIINQIKHNTEQTSNINNTMGNILKNYPLLKKRKCFLCKTMHSPISKTPGISDLPLEEAT